MNLVLVGPCHTSSQLAKALNAKLTNSLVYRHDLLAGFKTLPLGAECGLRRTEEFVGKHLGDVETNDLKKIPKELVEKACGLFNVLAGSNENDKVAFQVSLVKDSLNKFSKRVVTFNSASLNIVNIFSGILSKEMLSELSKTVKDCLIVKIISNHDTFLPIQLTEDEIVETVANDGKGMYLGSFKDVEALIASDEFKTFFNDMPVEDKKEVELKEKKVASGEIYRWNMVDNPLMGISRILTPPREMLIDAA